MNDYKVSVITNDNLDISRVIAKEDINEEEFSKLRTNFNVPSLGKMVCTYDRMMGVKKRYNYIKKLREDVKD